ncbi:MAG: GlsB/YeaQ/YmgE family stress response membrane protein [Pirellulaceae bacterium]
MNLIGSIIAWAVFGLIIGAVARLLYPGRQSMSIFMTMVLGIVGSLVGGLLTWAVGFGDPNEGAFHGAGWIMSIVGALIVVWIGIFATQSRPASGQRLR